MPILIAILVAGVLLYLWFARRNSTLTRACRWRLDRATGPDVWRCAACGAVTVQANGKPPRECLRAAS